MIEIHGDGVFTHLGNHARHLATRILRDTTVTTSGDQISLALRTTLSRTPKPQELTLLNGLHRNRLDRYRADTSAADKLLAIGASPVAPGLDRAELAALTDICLAIFNLSETVTRK